VGDVVRADLGLCQCPEDRPRPAASQRVRLGDVVGVGGDAGAEDGGVDARAAGLGVLLGLEDQDARALTEDEPVALEIIKSVVVEGVMIGLISWCIAVGLSFPISVGLLRIVSQAMIGAEMPLYLTPLGFGIWLLVVLILSVAASILPARNAARLTIREVLAYE
jgi:hypothetical protein